MATKAEVATFGGSTISALSASKHYFGMTLDEWSLIGIIGGLVVAVVGLIISTAMNLHYKRMHYKLAQDAMRSLPSNALKVADDD
jgi:hypothetical protein